MVVVSMTDFRTNQSKILDLANEGEDVVLKSRNRGSFRIIPVTHEEEATESKRDITAEIVEGLKQVRAHLDGKIELPTAKSLIDELRSCQD